MTIERDLADVTLPYNLTAAPPPPNWLFPPEILLFSIIFLALTTGAAAVLTVQPEAFDMAKIRRLVGRHLLAIGAFVPTGAVLGMFSADMWSFIRLKSGTLELIGLYAILYLCACFLDWGLQLLKRQAPG